MLCKYILFKCHLLKRNVGDKCPMDKNIHTHIKWMLASSFPLFLFLWKYCIRLFPVHKNLFINYSWQRTHPKCSGDVVEFGHAIRIYLSTYTQTHAQKLHFPSISSVDITLCRSNYYSSEVRMLMVHILLFRILRWCNAISLLNYSP